MSHLPIELSPYIRGEFLRALDLCLASPPAPGETRSVGSQRLTVPGLPGVNSRLVADLVAATAAADLTADGNWVSRNDLADYLTYAYPAAVPRHGTPTLLSRSLGNYGFELRHGWNPEKRKTDRYVGVRGTPWKQRSGDHT